MNGPASGGGRSFGGHTRLHKRHGLKASSARWLQRQLNDPYVKRARQEGWRARAAFKLMELDDRFHLLDGVARVVDLGTAPGSWAQVVRKRRPEARIVGVDLLDVEPLAGLDFVRGDFLAADVEALLHDRLAGAADLVLSDMAANSIGHARTDRVRTLALVEAAAAFAIRTLRPGGSFVVKVLGGGGDSGLVADLKRHFRHVRHAKPPASRKDSSEVYLVATGLRAIRNAD